MNESCEHLRQLVSKFSRVRGIDRPLAVLITVGAVLLFAFIKLAEEVMEGETQTFEINRAIQQRFPVKIRIAEDMQGEGQLTRDVAAGGAGFNAQWDIHFVHAVRNAA